MAHGLPTRPRPAKGQIHTTPRCSDLSKGVQRVGQDRLLGLHIAGFAKGLTQGMLQRSQPGHAYGLRQVRDTGERDRAQTRLFNRALYQSHGPVTDWSDRYQ